MLDGERPRLAVGAEPPTRPLLESLYTLPHHMAFLEAQGIDAAVFGPLMDVAGYSLPPDQGAAWSRAQNEGLAASLAAAGGHHVGLATVPLQSPAHAVEELSFAVRSLGMRGAMIWAEPPNERPYSIRSSSKPSSASAVTTCTTSSAIRSRRPWPPAA